MDRGSNIHHSRICSRFLLHMICAPHDMWSRNLEQIVSRGQYIVSTLIVDTVIGRSDGERQRDRERDTEKETQRGDWPPPLYAEAKKMKSGGRRLRERERERERE